MVAHPDQVVAADQYVENLDNRSFAEKRIAAIQYLQATHLEITDLKVNFKEDAFKDGAGQTDWGQPSFKCLK